MSDMKAFHHAPVNDELRGIAGVEPFSRSLAKHNIKLKRGETTTLQINVGLLCNQTCRHCHLEAGPGRPEVMDRETMDDIISYARRASFQRIDITGGAPELNPNLAFLIENLVPLTRRVMLRSNLTVINEGGQNDLIDLCREKGVTIVASLPSVNMAQTDSLRGRGVLEKSIKTLQKLNESGYGQDETGLELDLVSNPPGAFLPPPQSQAERKFKSDLQRKWGIVFNNLYAFANVPLGRFLNWLKKSGNLEMYMEKLAESFNPDTIDGLMCRTLISVSWNGCLFDCDFNLAENLYWGGARKHVSEMEGLPEPGISIVTGDHCYACTAGSGFT